MLVISHYDSEKGNLEFKPTSNEFNMSLFSEYTNVRMRTELSIVVPITCFMEIS